MKLSILFLSFFLSFFVAPAARAKIVSRPVVYQDKGTTLEGFVAYDDAQQGKRPGVLVVHEWTGVGDYVKERARLLAKMGYVAFAPDIYGQGIRPTAGKAAGELAGKYKGDRPLMRERAFAGLDALKKQPNVDPSRLAAIGYCFGGTVVLELARAGADLQGVASFHGGLAPGPQPAEAGKVKAKVVAFHGAEDPTISPEELKGFEDEMRKAKVDWTLTKYANAVHSFTNPHTIGANAFPGAEYNANADRRSWVSLQDYFHEWFSPR